MSQNTSEVLVDERSRGTLTRTFIGNYRRRTEVIYSGPIMRPVLTGLMVALWTPFYQLFPSKVPLGETSVHVKIYMCFCNVFSRYWLTDFYHSRGQKPKKTCDKKWNLMLSTNNNTACYLLCSRTYPSVDNKRFSLSDSGGSNSPRSYIS